MFSSTSAAYTNSSPAILTPKLLLVPYSEHHVPTYHEWMQDKDLQKATASEPLDIDQEYAMQRSWRTDADKLTFIVCSAPVAATADDTKSPCKIPDVVLEAGKQDSPDAMIGDINLFLNSDEDQDDDPEQVYEHGGEKGAQSVVGEVEIMIAVAKLQGKGLGKAVLLTFLWYVNASLDAIMSEYHAGYGNGKARSCLKYLRVKIDSENSRSIRLFESVGFSKVSESPNYFGELELRLSVSDVAKGEVEERLDSMPLMLKYP